MTHRWDHLPSACPKNVELGFASPHGYLSAFKKYEPKAKAVHHRDYSVRGLAHTGLLPNMTREMMTLGAPVKEVAMNQLEVPIRGAN